MNACDVLGFTHVILFNLPTVKMWWYHAHFRAEDTAVQTDPAMVPIRDTNPTHYTEPHVA